MPHAGKLRVIMANPGGGMRFIIALSACVLGAGTAVAQTSEEVCEVTAGVVTKAQELRLDGLANTEAVATLTEEYAEESDTFRDQAIPLLVNDFVYAQPDEALEQDLAAFWKQTCLSTDLSSVLGTD